MRTAATTVLAGLVLTFGVPVAAAETTVAPPEVPPEPARTVFTDNPAIVDPQPTAVESWSRSGDGVTVNFTAGTPQCYGAHAHVRETAETVTVALWTGTLPEALGRACIAIAVFGTLDVPLQAPLGARRVLAEA